MDLNELASVHSFAAAYLAKGLTGPVLLVNNAGIMNTPFAITKDGFEQQFQANHLGHFLLTHLLMPSLVPGSRVVNLASRAHLRWQGFPVDYDALVGYIIVFRLFFSFLCFRCLLLVNMMIMVVVVVVSFVVFAM